MPDPKRTLTLFFVLLLVAYGCSSPRFPSGAGAIRTPVLSRSDIAKVGQAIWQNECAGRVDQLVYWKDGEEWPSVGIGHFIWPPSTYAGTFKAGEFHRVLAYLQSRGVKTPKWMCTHAPWTNKRAFERDTRRRRELQELMHATIALQAEYIVNKLTDTLPRLASHVPPEQRDLFTRRVNRLLRTPKGTFALIDYLNFKGAGTAPQEQYQGHRWGLLQVVLGMQDDQDPLRSFVASAKWALRQRVYLSDPKRNEARWLPGWLARLDRYL